MIFGGAFFLSLIALAFLILHPQVGVLLLLAFKPIIDASWQHSLFGYNALEIVGVMVPLIVLFRIFLTRDTNLNEMPLLLLWLIYVFVNLISFVMILGTGRLLGSLDFLFRILNGFAGYCMLQTYFSNKLWFKRLLIAFLLAGLFPMLMGVYQMATGEIWQLRHATGGLVRSVGIYHDAFSFRVYAYMTITAILLYWSYFSKNSFYMKMILAAYGLICLLVIFRIYSKAGYIIFIAWLFVWTIMNKKIGWLLVIIIGVLALNFFTGNKIFKDVATVFSKETAAIEGTGETRKILAGRSMVWESYLDRWRESEIFYKIFGLGTSAGAAHNDYLRVLVGGGIIGLLVYIALLVTIGWKIIITLVREKTPLHIMTLMIFLMWLIDTIGLVPGQYPAYQWFIWGFIGLALRGVKDLKEENT
ncbi:MAG: hypothetical protein JRI95_15030 [Deltaproteobacteria bacterium]|nr:hypothetical protein [Deltaproteobacteria bacterium]